jgi:hypothetical protein
MHAAENLTFTAAGADSVPLGHAKALASVLDGHLLAPELISAYLSKFAARDAGRIDRSERVVAGQPAKCIAILKPYPACATESGILAHFSAPEGALRSYQPGGISRVVRAAVERRNHRDRG